MDLGLIHFVNTSDGKKVSNPRYFEKALAKLTKLSKSLSRKSRGSRNYSKTRLKLAKCYEKISNQRKDFLHKLSTNLVKDYDLTKNSSTIPLAQKALAFSWW